MEKNTGLSKKRYVTMEKNYGFMKKAMVLFTVIFFVRRVIKNYTGHEILRSKSCINKFGDLN